MLKRILMQRRFSCSMSVALRIDTGMPVMLSARTDEWESRTRMLHVTP
jgi:hypothetical protein